MSNTLTKDISQILVNAGQAASPGQPYVPAHTSSVTVMQTQFSYVYQFGIRLPDGSFKNASPTDPGAVLINVIMVTKQVPVTQTVYYPEQPYIPPSAYAPPSYVAQYNLGWNGGARSIASVVGDGAAQFSVAAGVTGVVVGLTGPAPVFAYNEATHALYFTKGAFNVVESGTTKGTTRGYVASDVFSIVRQGGTVRYYQNNTLVYTSQTVSSGTAYLSSALYSGGDQVANASFSSTIPATLGAHGAASAAMLPFATVAGKTNQRSSSAAMLPLTTLAQGTTKQGAIAAMAPMRTLAGRAAQSASAAALAPLQTVATMGMPAPTLNRAAAGFAVMGTASTGKTGTITLHTGPMVMRPLITQASNKRYASSNAAMAPMSGFASYALPINATLFGTITGGYGLNASVTDQTATSLIATLPALSLRANMGAQASAKLPRGMVTIAATVPNVCRADALLPRGALTAHGFAGSSGAMVGRLVNRPSLVAYAGSVIRATLHDGYALNAHAVPDNVATLTATLPMVQVTAASEGVTGAVLDATLPMLAAVPSAQLAALLPRGYMLEAIGTAVVAVAYEAYAMNLQPPNAGTPYADPHAVTHFLGFPFKQILRFGTDYYGVADDGLYKLGGDTDAGKPIPWAVQTCETDFGETAMKRISGVYVGGRVMTDITATVTAEPPEAPGTRKDYDYVTQRSAGAQNTRVVTGRGLRSRYYAFGLSDDHGDGVTVDSLDFEVDVLKRGI